MERNTATTRVAVVPSANGVRVKPAASVEQLPPEFAYDPGQEVLWPEFRQKLLYDLAPRDRTAGLHWSMLAITRGGKTTLSTKGLIPLYLEAEIPVLVIDSTSDPKLKKFGSRIPRIGGMKELHKVSVDSLGRSAAEEIHRALSKAYSQGDILIYVDEIRHVADPKFLGLGMALENIYLFGGKRGVTLGGVTQAPRWVPSSFYDQAKAHFLFRVRDDRSRKRCEEISGDTATLRPLLPELSKYQFAYVSPDGDVVRSKYALRNSPK